MLSAQHALIMGLAKPVSYFKRSILNTSLLNKNGSLITYFLIIDAARSIQDMSNANYYIDKYYLLQSAFICLFSFILPRICNILLCFGTKIIVAKCWIYMLKYDADMYSKYTYKLLLWEINSMQPNNSFHQLRTKISEQ